MRQAQQAFTIIYHLKSAIQYSKTFILENSKENLFSIILKNVLPKLEWAQQTIVTHHLLPLYTPELVELIREKTNEHPVEELALIEKIQVLKSKELRELEIILEALLAGKKVDYTIT